MLYDRDYRQILTTGRLELDSAKINNSEDQLIATTLENSWNMLIRSRGRILATAVQRNVNANMNTIRTTTGTDELLSARELAQTQAQLSGKEQGWLNAIDNDLIALIDQADQAGLLKK